MIPDFPEEKEKILRIWHNYLLRKINNLSGFVNEIPSFQHHEGNKWKLDRSVGDGEESEYNEFSAGFEIKIEEVPQLTPEKIKEKIDKVAEEMVKQTTQSIFSTIIEAADKAGTSIDAKGEEFSPELFIETLERMDLSFDEKGNLIPPMIVVNPSFWEKYKDKFSEWEKDDELTKRHEKVIAQKREEWNARESRRKLVD